MENIKELLLKDYRKIRFPSNINKFYEDNYHIYEIGSELNSIKISNDKINCINDNVLSLSQSTITLNDTYLGWSQPEGIQWSNITMWDNRQWRIWFNNLDTDGIGATSTQVIINTFTTFNDLILELNNLLANYGSSFRLIGHQDGNRILVTDLNFNPLLDVDPYLVTYKFQNMELVIEDAITSSDWLVKGRNPKDLPLINVDFGVTGYSFKTYQCPKSICEQLKEIPDGTYDVTDKLVVLGQAQTLDVQGWFYDGVNTGNGFMEVPFTSGNQVSINALIVDGIDYIPGGSVTNTYSTFQDFIDVVNSLITASGVQLATSSDNDFYVVGSDSNPIAQTLVFDFYDGTASAWFTKTWNPDTIQIQTEGECKLVELDLPQQGWGLSGNTDTNPSTDFLGTTDLKPITFKTNNVKRGIFTRNGNFVVGVNEALIEQMDTSGFGFNGISTINTTHNIFNFSPTGAAFGWAGIAAGGSPSLPTIPVSNSFMGATNGLNYDGAGNFRTVCRMRYHNVGQPTASSMPTKIIFSTTRTGNVSSVEAFQISQNQFIGLGTLAPFAQNPLSTIDVGGSIGLNIRRVAVSTTLLDNDRTVVFTATGLTATLPTPSVIVNARREYVIKNKSTGTLDITGSIDDVIQTITIGAGDSRTFHGDGTTWFLI